MNLMTNAGSKIVDIVGEIPGVGQKMSSIDDRKCSESEINDKKCRVTFNSGD